MVAGCARAIGTFAFGAVVGAVTTRALSALVVVAVVLAVRVAVVEVVNVVVVDDGLVPAGRAVGVVVRFGLGVCRHDCSFVCSIASRTMCETCSSVTW